MHSYFFCICGIRMELRSELPLSPDEDMLRFRTGPGSADLRITCREAESVEPAGIPCGTAEDLLAFRDGSRIRRCALTAGTPYAMLSYREDDFREAYLDIARAHWPWVTRGLQLWIAADFPVLLTHFGACLIHASFIGYRGRGILFTAPSQTGKSTQAGLWQRFRGAEILNGDKAGIRITDSVTAHSVPFSGTSGICTNRSLPLQAIVVLSQAPENSVRRLAPSRAISAVCGNIFADRAVPEEWAMVLRFLADLVSRVPVYALACTPDERAVEALEQILFP